MEDKFIILAVRCALGRNPDDVTTVCNYIKHRLCDLETGTLKQIIYDINANNEFGFYVCKVDKKLWEDLKTTIIEELKRRKIYG